MSTSRLLSLLVLLSATWITSHALTIAQTPTPPPPSPTTPAPPPPPSPTLSGELSFAASGDSILLRPISVYEQEPAFKGLLSLMRNATVAFTNFEMSVFDTQRFVPTPQAEYGGLWVHGTPQMAQELKWLGIDMVARANNHTADYGVEGMLETDQILDALHVVRAGSGRTLGEARAPAYFQTAVGRVAMISTASSHSPMARAANPRPDIKGRPGLSPLRWSRVVYLDAPSYTSLKNTMMALDTSPKPTPISDEQMTVFGTSVRRGDKNRSELVANPADVKEILDQVKTARRQADLVFVTIHAHEPGNRSETPADFLPGFARAAIDAGADMFIAHGPHQLRGVELYKQRPIFYSLANFFFHYQTLEPQGAEVYEANNLDPFRSTIANLYDAVPGWGRNFTEDIWWESVVALVKFDNGRLKSVELHPIDLGAALPRAQKGTPRIASPALARKIVDRIARLSTPFGTTISFANNIGVVQLNTPTSDKVVRPVSLRGSVGK
jgi:poly-gamma-glutamate capsule biosynthesis protein CapA/YwtB (metallophosphatase superfamily)